MRSLLSRAHAAPVPQTRNGLRGLLLAVAAVVPVLDLVLAQPPAAAGKKYALLVGVNEYDHRKLDPLRFAERDVTELAKVLEANGFKVRVLLGSAAGKDKATRENIAAAVAEHLKTVTRRDTLLTAFAGHGQQFKPAGEKEEQPFFCPVDAVPNDAKTLFAFNALLTTLDDKGAGTNLVLVDACRTINDPNRGTRSGIDGSKAVALTEGTVVFFACSRDQEARETEKADGGHGVFFHHVIDGLKGGAANRRGQVTWDGLVAHVKDKTREHHAEWFPDVAEGKRQRPQSIGNLSDALVLGTAAPRAEPPPPPADIAKADAEITTKSGITLVKLPGKKFLMGSPATDKYADKDRETPQHEQTVGAFYMGVTEVTRGQFAVVEEIKRGDDFALPATNLTWVEAVEFCNKLSRAERLEPYYEVTQAQVTINGGTGYRLPTEAEWEYASRGGGDTRWACGNDPRDLGKFAWYKDNSDGKLRPCGRLTANAFGLKDMHGNAAEWCWDPYASYTTPAKPAPTSGKTAGETKVVRGGSCSSALGDCRSASRLAWSAGLKSEETGFRVARNVVP